jgi:hypothetical protein
VDAGIVLPAGFSAWGGWWMTSDGGLSFVNFAKLNELTPPYGYSIAEFAAERRLGTSLANEFDGELSWNFGDHTDVFVNGAIVTPGSFYTLEIDRVAGTALGSTQPVPAWSTYAGVRVGF